MVCVCKQCILQFTARILLMLPRNDHNICSEPSIFGKLHYVIEFNYIVNWDQMPTGMGISFFHHKLNLILVIISIEFIWNSMIFFIYDWPLKRVHSSSCEVLSKFASWTTVTHHHDVAYLCTSVQRTAYIEQTLYKNIKMLLI